MPMFNTLICDVGTEYRWEFCGVLGGIPDVVSKYSDVVMTSVVVASVVVASVVVAFVVMASVVVVAVM